MLSAAWPDVRNDLASTRQGAAAFLNNLDAYGAVNRQNWGARWTSIGDAHCLFGDLNSEKGAVDQAAKAWLCALTAFEVARRLASDDDPQSGAVLAKAEACIQRYGSLEQKLKRVQIACCDQAEPLVYYLRASGLDSCAPTVICISSEEETATTLLGRLLPVVIGREISIIVVSHQDVSNTRRNQSEVLSCCMDYLTLQPEIDVSRIGIYGEGLSAALATTFAASDRRVAAAVCDGGLWDWARNLASVGWMTSTANAVDENMEPTRRSQLVRQLRCPVLVVAGGRGFVSVPEAAKLRADCAAARIDLALVVPRMTSTPLGEIENFVASDDCIFGWLEHKLATQSCRSALSVISERC